MLTVGTRIKLVAFLLIGVSIIVYIGLRYADLGRLVGDRGYYVVKLDLADSGGIFTNAAVTYRGVSVGRVGPLNLTDSGVEVDLDINNSVRIPANAQAVVADRSAVGEQYVDLRPKSVTGPMLVDGSVVPQQNTELPIPVQDVLGSVDSLAGSVPTRSLQIVVDQLYTATDGQGPNLQVLLDTSSDLADAASQDIPNTSALLDNSRTVLRTQFDETDALDSFGRNAELLAQQLNTSDPDLRKLIATAPQAAGQLSGLLQDTQPDLGVLLANLLTTADLTLTRQSGIEQLLATYPTVVNDGSTAFTANGANVGLALTFFDPMPCTAGYGGTTYRNGLDTGASPPLNTSARCTLPAGSGIDVRGSAHAPSGGGVPQSTTNSPGAVDPLSGNDSSTNLSHLLGLTANP
ncbi:MAG TPA: MlaD family protein [Pseudonocardiaceae bacterium]|nr:MlaD family protein [Pseudonocardiaceae bacterium]